jgi:hypothetical protein
MTGFELGEVQAAARKLGLDVASFEFRRAENIMPVFEELKSRADALYIGNDTARSWRPSAQRYSIAMTERWPCLSRAESRLEAENAALWHQLTVLQRKVRGWVQFTNSDRVAQFG